MYQGASPSKKSIGRLKDKVSDILVAGNPGTWDEVSDRLNASLRGWSGYFAYGSRAEACRAVNHHVAERVRVFLTRRHVMLRVRGATSAGTATKCSLIDVSMGNSVC